MLLKNSQLSSFTGKLVIKLSKSTEYKDLLDGLSLDNSFKKSEHLVKFLIPMIDANFSISEEHITIDFWIKLDVVKVSKVLSESISMKWKMSLRQIRAYSIDNLYSSQFF